MTAGAPTEDQFVTDGEQRYYYAGYAASLAHPVALLALSAGGYAELIGPANYQGNYALRFTHADGTSASVTNAAGGALATLANGNVVDLTAAGFTIYSTAGATVASGGFALPASSSPGGYGVAATATGFVGAVVRGSGATAAIHVESFGSTGALLASADLSGFSGTSFSKLQATAIGGGNVLISWIGADSASVHGQIVDANARKLGGELLIGGGIGAASSYSAATLASGDVALGWSLPSGELLGTVLHPDGNAATLFQVNGSDGYSALSPSVAALGSGGFAMVWRGTRTGGDNAVLGQTFSAAGAPTGGELLIGTPAQFVDYPLAVGFGAGNLLVTWQPGSYKGGPLDGSAEFLYAPIDGTSGADTLTGTAGTEYLRGLDGDDRLYGLGGRDFLYGGAGNDVLDGGAGADRMVGGTGDDTYYVDDLPDTVIELAGEGNDTVYTSAVSTATSMFMVPVNVETVIMTGSADKVGGNGGTYTIIGNALANTLDGTGLNDVLIGGAGDDTYYANASTTIVENAGEGIDSVIASASFTLFANIENLSFRTNAGVDGTGNELDNVITGTAFADRLFGLGGNDRLFGMDGNDVLDGGNGDDYLDGGTGADRMTGGAGNDTYIVDNSGDVVVEGVEGGIDTVQASVSYALPDNVENLTLTGTAAINGTGNALDNVIIGNGGANRLDGGAGDDVLIGGFGADVLTGGTGNDIFQGALVQFAGDRITDLLAGDRIRVTDVAYAGFAYTHTGSALTISGASIDIGSANPHLVVQAAPGGGTDLVAANHWAGVNDFDGNGHSDILWRYADGAITTWGVSGNAAGNQFAVASTVITGVSNAWAIAETLDWNGDGHSDILFRNASSGDFSIWTGGNNAWTANALLAGGISADWKIAGAGDLNGDGKDDLVWRNDGGQLTTWLSTGTGFQTNAFVDGSVSPDWKIVGLGDFDGDGKADLLWRNAGTGVFTEWRSTGTGFQQNAYVNGTVDTGWHVDAVADFNGDGKDDLLWRHDGDGGFTVWQSTGSGFTPNVYGDNSVNPVWQIAATGDFNDDGRADILWRNVADGTFTTWQSNGDGFDPNVAVVGGVGTDWHVQAHDLQFG